MPDAFSPFMKKELVMPFTKPNRTRSQSADRNEMQQKQSGDQHTLPVDDPDEGEDRPQRVNRQDIQKTPADDAERKGQGST